MALARSWAPVEWRLAQRMPPTAVSTVIVIARTIAIARSEALTGAPAGWLTRF